MRFFTIAGFALYWLDIRLFDHRTPSASLSPVLCSRLRTLKMSSFFSMAIWRRNVIVSLIAIVTLMAGLALNIRSTLPIPTLLHDDISLMSFHPRSYDGEHVVPLQRMTHFNFNVFAKVDTSYDTILEACTTLHTRRGLVNSIGVLAVDVVLLLAMLIGLLRSAHRNSTGIWYLLYQQVSLSPSFYTCHRC